ncbi:MAG: UDP-N-acetylmuramate dehydrogenase [bacterium]|nr:UDP-N-acetylmuramate dehydrogenase [bacterium]
MMALHIQENVPLAPLTTFKTGGPARFFCTAKSEGELRQAIEFARSRRIPFFVLGGGSNVLIPDRGFFGLAIKNEIKVTQFIERREEVSLVAGAGENWDALVAMTVQKNLYGLENLSGIPGTVGAAPIQNIGAYGVEVADVLSHVDVFDAEEMKEKRFDVQECMFSYRNSLFKSAHGKRFIITAVGFVLKKEGQCRIHYKDLALAFNDTRENITPQKIRSAVLEIRKQKFPDLTECGTAGSFFKNPIIDEAEYLNLVSRYRELPGYPEKNGKIKIPLAWILDKVCLLKGYRKGNVGLFSNQPLVVVNYGNATTEEIINFTREVSQKVFEAAGLTIESEVRILGEIDLQFATQVIHSSS